jgi:hypothetical protein
MAILSRTVMPGTAAESDEWFARVGGVLAAAPGFILQADGPAPEGGWQIVSVWESEADLMRYFDSAVRPYLAPEAAIPPTAEPVAHVIRPGA